MQRQRAFTLIELLVVVSLIAIVLTLAGPSFSDFIKLQRLKSVNAQLVTDMQFARTEAAARNMKVEVRFDHNDQASCYVLFTGAVASCNCTASPVCPAGSAEIRTTQVRADLGVQVRNSDATSEFAFDPATGAIVVAGSDLRGGPPSEFGIDTFIDTPRTLHVVMNLAGRPIVCAPTTSTMPVPRC